MDALTQLIAHRKARIAELEKEWHEPSAQKNRVWIEIYCLNRSIEDLEAFQEALKFRNCAINERIAGT